MEYKIELTPEQVEKIEELTGVNIQCSTDLEYAIKVILEEL